MPDDIQKKIAEISPLDNGVHSLASGLKHIATILSGTPGPFELKDAVLKIHHGFETLFKFVLFLRNPVFLLPDKTKIEEAIKYHQDFYRGKCRFFFDTANTITAIQAIARLEELEFIVNYPPEEYRLFKQNFGELNDIRNAIQHFAVRFDEERVIQIFGNLVSRGVALFKACTQSDIPHPFADTIECLSPKSLLSIELKKDFSKLVDKMLIEGFDESITVMSTLHHRYDVQLKMAREFFKKRKIEGAPLKMVVDDHGACGATPHFPDLKLSGWINAQCSPHTNGDHERNEHQRREATYRYSASLALKGPDYSELIAAKEIPGFKALREARFEVIILGRITIDKPEAIFDFNHTDAQKHAVFLRNTIFSFEISATFKCTTWSDGPHFTPMSPCVESGRMRIGLEGNMYGDPSSEKSVQAIQEILLDAHSLKVDMHAFLDPHGRFNDNRSVKVSIEATSDIKFH